MLDTGTQLRNLRSDLREALNAHVPPAGRALSETPELMVLVATELATNALTHGRPPTVVRLLRTRDEFILDVADPDLSTIPRFAVDRPKDAGGRGLHLVNALAHDVGWYLTDHTKHVWAAFPINP